MLWKDTTNSLNTRVGAKTEIQSKEDKADELGGLQEQVTMLNRKVNCLARFTFKMFHRSSLTLSNVFKEELDKNTMDEGPNYIGEDVLNLLVKKWEGLDN